MADTTPRMSYLEYRRRHGGRIAPAPAARDVAPATPKVAPKPGRGRQHEDALYKVLAEEFIDLGSMPERVRLGDTVVVSCLFVRQYPWGAYLPEPRGFSSDAGFPVKRVLVEIDGGAHAAGKAKQRTDTERRGLAGAAGWRVVAVTPEMVYDGRAIDLVKKALGTRRDR